MDLHLQEVAGNHGVAMWGRGTEGFATDPIMVENHLIFVTTRIQIRMDSYPQWCAAAVLVSGIICSSVLDTTQRSDAGAHIRCLLYCLCLVSTVQSVLMAGSQSVF